MSIDYGTSQSVVHGGVVADPVNMPMSIENPQFDLNDPDAYDLLTDGASSSAGIRVSHTKALMHSAVHQALDLISGDIASLPLELYLEEPDGDRVLQTGHPLHDVIRWQPNEKMNAFRFWRRMIAWKLLWGNSYAFIIRRGDGQVKELLPLLPDRTAPEQVNGKLYYVTEVEGKLEPMLPEEVFHLESLPMDNLAGFDFIKSAREAIGLALGAMDFASKFYKNGGRVGGVLEVPASTSKTAKDKIQQGWDRSYSSNEAFKTVILRDNAKFHQAQMSPEQAQVVDGRRESVRDIARFFNVRPGKLGEESKNSFASKSEDNRDHYDTTLRPHCYEITQECRNKLLSATEKSAGFYFQHSTQELLRMDFKSMAEAIQILRSAEVASPNESRRLINWNKRTDPGGDDYTNPNTKSNSGASSGNDQQPPANQTANAFRSLLTATVQRMASGIAKRAKHHAEHPGKFCDWIDNSYHNQRESIESAVSEVLSSASIVFDIDVTEATNEVTNSFLEESLQILQTVAASTEAKDLQAVAAANITEWASGAGTRFADAVFTDTKICEAN